MGTGAHLPAVRRWSLTAFVFAADISEEIPHMKQNPIRQVVFPILAALIWGTAFVAQDV